MEDIILKQEIRIKDFFIKAGATIRKHDSGLVEYCRKSDSGMTVNVPIEKQVPVINNWTETQSLRFDTSLGEKIWQEALKQK